jgi:hypothetical protein
VTSAGGAKLRQFDEAVDVQPEVETIRPDAVVFQYRIVLENSQQNVVVCRLGRYEVEVPVMGQRRNE